MTHVEKSKSSYEKHVLLEGRVARIAAWLMNLVMLALIVVYILAVAPYNWAQLALGLLLLGYFAHTSYKCEYRAQDELKRIWEAEMTERLVHGAES